ncbi:hypothetical protein I3F58_28030 [Streptomyces sp. MUM 203J]|nr:hypothetical protein [Streptomyces sp. MUM 203J]
MCRADAEVGDAAGPVRLVRQLGYDHLGRARQSGRGRGARTAVADDGGDMRDQGVVVDLAEGV